MRVKVTEKEVVISQYSTICEGDVKVNKCDFDLPESFKELSVTASFNNIPLPIIGGSCYIPTLKKGTATLGVYAYKDINGGIELMYSPKSARFYVQEGSYSEDVAVEEIPTISEFERYCQELKNIVVLKSGLLKNYDNDFHVKPDDVYSAYAVKQAVAPFYNYPYKDMISNSIILKSKNNLAKCIKDISPIKHNVKVKTSGRLTPQMWAEAELVKVGNNIFTFTNREKRSILLNQSKALFFNSNGIFVGYDSVLSETNDDAVEIINIDKSKDEIKAVFKDTNKGLSFDIIAEPNLQYNYSIPAETGITSVNIIKLDVNGNTISKENRPLEYSFTVDEGVRNILLELVTTNINKELSIAGIMVNYGDNLMPYEPYKRLEVVPIKKDTEVLIESEYPTTNLFTYNARIIVSCEYNGDAGSIYKQIREAIISLGGNI